ncbi:MAG: decaprenyl-phosphate phosphoribosyltransferase [Anaerolineae bacterium]|nr:decaprenyl-phosphate phosphoribosyltransferase [Anaerolineae bacterium]
MLSKQTLFGLLRTMRPKQWVKNGFIFVPLFFDGQFFPLGRPFLCTLVGFALLCLIASTIYLVNDIVDIERDKLHPTKRKRPLPAGEISVRAATTAALLLPLVALALGYLLAPWFALMLITYLALHLAYSFWLKNIVIIDMLAIATGFVLRVAAGQSLITVKQFSPWMYVFTIMLALFLVVGKRRQELITLASDAELHRTTYREYNLALLDQLLNVVTTSSLVVYALYTFEATGPYARYTMMFTIPYVIYGIFRYLYLIHVHGEGGAPDEVVLKDRPLQIDLVLCGLTGIFIIYILPHNGAITAFLASFLAGS